MHPVSGGLRVFEVMSGSPADVSDVRAGDLLTHLDGRPLASVADFTPRPDVRQIQITIRRPGQPSAITATASLRGFGLAPPSDLVAVAVLLLIAFVVVMIFMAPTAGITTWVERRVAGRMQSRIGPNRAGPNGFLVWMADGIKSITKEDIIPDDADKPLFRLAPYLVFIGVTATFVVMPFSRSWIAADLDVGMLYIIAVTSLVTIGIMTGGWASNNKWSLLGGIRSAAQIISYEVPAAVAIVCIVMLSGTLRLQGIVEAQGAWPWEWWIFKNPVAFVLFPLYFTAALAEGNRAPFDLPEAESELVAGYSTEYSGMRYLFFFFAEWANVFVMSGIATALFLGGWQLPGVSPSTMETGWYWEALGALLFVTKSWALIFVVIWVRWTLPRVRIDQMMNMCWKWFVPLTFAGFFLTAIWLALELPPIVETIVGFALTAIGAIGLGWFVSRVRYNLRQARVGTGGMQGFHINPFI
ncbi:MAG: NADH-quinone oxidoreductase subunit NuoH [Deltaproteobacteria bacterium]|nr:NADH-quinone oxidoreductase subunit NuoH [Deltaproteobacteria bacterium]